MSAWPKYLSIGAILMLSFTACNDAPAAQLPPDPGEVGKTTLEGVDTNNNGIRDDVERHIQNTYGSQVELVPILNEYARASQEALLNGKDVSRARMAVEKEQLSLGCLYLAKDKDLESVTTVLFDLDAVILNTQLREDTDLEVENTISGEVFTLAPTEALTNQCRTLSGAGAGEGQ